MGPRNGHGQGVGVGGESPLKAKPRLVFSFCLEKQAEQMDIATAVSETLINRKHLTLSLYQCINPFIDEDKMR